MLMLIRKLKVLWFRSPYSKWVLPIISKKRGIKKYHHFNMITESLSWLGRISPYKLGLELKLSESDSAIYSNSSIYFEVVFEISYK